MQKGERRPNRFELRGEVAVIFIRRRRKPDLECKIDAEDLDRAMRHTWSLSGHAPYLYIRAASPPIKLHRFLMNAPDDAVVDHVHGDTFDNRKSELRVTTQSINAHNRSRRPPRNVHWHKQNKSWRVTFMIDWKRRDFGLFKSLDEAKSVASSVRERLVRGEAV